MTKLKLLGAAAVLAAAVATPVMAQEAISEPSAYAQSHPWANGYDDGYGYRSGFWPGDVAADLGGPWHPPCDQYHADTVIYTSITKGSPAGAFQYGKSITIDSG